MTTYSHTPSHNDIDHITKQNNEVLEPTVIVYSTNSCPFCIYAKDFFDNNNIPYVDKNVGSDRAAAEEMISKNGQMGVPVIDINGEILVGYQPEKFAELLGL